MAEPLAARLAAKNPGGVLGPSGVAKFRKLFNPANSAEVFHNWAEHPITAAVAGAVRDLALHSPVAEVGDPENHLIQYGIGVGLSLAAQLLTDPSSVYPEMFTGTEEASGAVKLPDMTFSTDPFDDHLEIQEN